MLHKPMLGEPAAEREIMKRLTIFCHDISRGVGWLLAEPAPEAFLLGWA